MDDFSDLLTKRPQGKSAPMAPQTKAKSSDSSSWVFDDLSRDGGGDDLLFKSKPSSMPVYDKPVYDDEDVFEAIPELTTSQSARFDENISSILSPSRHQSSPLDDLIGRGNSTGSSASAFDDLIPGFGRASSPQTKRPTSETTSQSQTPPPYRTTSSNFVEDPFVVLQEDSASATPKQEFIDPLDEIGKFNTRKTDDHSHGGGGVFVDIDPLDSLVNGRDKTHLRSEQHVSGFQSPVKSSGSYHAKNVSFDEVLEPHNASFDSSDDVWLTVSEIPLFTQPTTAPPPSRPPPPRPTRPMKNKVNEHVRSPARASAATPMDELDDFASGRFQTAPNEQPLYGSGGGDDSDVFSSASASASAAAMKDAMDKAEAKFRHAKERREKDNLKASRNREGVDPVDNSDSRERENQARLDREREAEMEREREREREREQKRIERERERLLARQAVERATREARERAATEARAKAQRAAVEKASSDARERAERAAVQRAHAEARERAATGARERAERAAAEAREKQAANAEAKVRSERAAVEKAAAEARARAAAQAKAKQQEDNNNDLDSFFNSVSRPSSAPRQRTNPPVDPFQDSWNRGGSYESSRASSRAPSGASENLRKTSSATNIVDDLSSIFGAATQSGGFQDIEGETEERRRARLERHQRTQERAAKALAEKNDRDLQVQREQAEKNRIGETLDVEIKRWGAGKEANLRALLSTLQYVLWPECGWQPVSLTDLITAASVKKFYRKATLCIHPDKVQQKGANLQQKYIAEKVFDMLKEAWNKFNSEELF
ncbi:auxilin-related protein 2 isoform X2 [Raphanus sativus]|uniref:Auxilin-related protein 2 isoform X2 n=1 Tax=Raphanus sativus TaxID=3726 RepID=A0A6J0NIJ8_RAPSA|nr:auxilin-related protein 2 isoform X2 [Raphanus sativus]